MSRRSVSKDVSEAGKRRSSRLSSPASSVKSENSYYESDDSGEKSDDGDAYLTCQQRRDKKKAKKQLDERRASRSSSRGSRKSSGTRGSSRGRGRGSSLTPVGRKTREQRETSPVSNVDVEMDGEFLRPTDTPSTSRCPSGRNTPEPRRGRGRPRKSLTPVNSRTIETRETSPSARSNVSDMDFEDEICLTPARRPGSRVEELRTERGGSVSSEISHLTLRTPPSGRVSKRERSDDSEEEMDHENPRKKRKPTAGDEEWKPYKDTRKGRQQNDTRKYLSKARVELHRRRKRELKKKPDPKWEFPEPHVLPAHTLPAPEECPFCAAIAWPKRRVCCGNGLVFIPPLRRLPKCVWNVLFSDEPRYKKARKKLMLLNVSLAFASLQYDPVKPAKFGEQVMKIRGSVSHFPSCVKPHGKNRPLFGNLYVYTGDEADKWRETSFGDLDQEVVSDIRKFVEKHNRFAKFYRTMGELMAEYEHDERKVRNMRMKIVSAKQMEKKDLQGHPGIYRSARGGDQMAVFYDCSVDQNFFPPGLIIYPRTGENVMLPIFHWTDIVTPLCYTLLFPRGEFFFSRKKFPLAEDRTKPYLERLKEYAIQNPTAAQRWESDIPVDELTDGIVLPLDPEVLEKEDLESSDEEQEDQREADIPIQEALEETINPKTVSNISEAGETAEEDQEESDVEENLEDIIYPETVPNLPEDGEIAGEDEEPEEEEDPIDHVQEMEDELQGFIMQGEQEAQQAGFPEAPLTVPAIPSIVYPAEQEEQLYEMDDDDEEEYLPPEKPDYSASDNYVLGPVMNTIEEIQEARERIWAESARVLAEEEVEEELTGLEAAVLMEMRRLKNGGRDSPVDSDADGSLTGDYILPGKRSHITMRQYINQSFYPKKSIRNRLLKAGRLGQFLLIDHYTRVNTDRATVIREKRGQYMTSSKKKMLDAFQKRMDQKNIKGKIGALLPLPSDVAGSPRWLRKKFERAVTLSNRLGKPDLFLTATTNTQWEELKALLKEVDCDSSAGAHLTNQCFQEKLDALMDLINGNDKKPGIFGPCGWATYSIEFQQRGPPHAHIIVSLVNKIKTTAQLQNICQAELPTDNAELRELVEKFMVHRPCSDDPQAYCREGCEKKTRCNKGFPKEFNETCRLDEVNYADLIRPDNGETSSRDPKADNRWVVPYNTQLLTFWQGHLNVEVISSLKVVKYIFKYVFKGFDRVLVEISTEDNSMDPATMTIDGNLIYPKNLKIPPGVIEKRKKDIEQQLRKRGINLTEKDGTPVVVYDELWMVDDLRAVTPNEAAWMFAAYPRAYSTHHVVELNVHLENHEPVCFEAGEEAEMVEELKSGGYTTKLTAFFKLCQENSLAKDLTFEEVPEHFRFHKGEWIEKKRKRANVIGKINSVPPSCKELFAIRMLCLNKKGPTSFEDLKTVDGVAYDSAIDAAKALGFMNDQREWDLCLAEADSYSNPITLRRLFCAILTNNPVSNALELYQKYREKFFEKRNWTDEQKEAHSLNHMESYLRVHFKTLEDFGLPSVRQEDLPATDLIDDSGASKYPLRQSKYEAQKLIKMMTPEQLAVFNEILASIKSHENDRKSFFLQGSGGTGKTLVMKALYHQLRSEDIPVACVAHTGIAASLLPMGSTAHRLFRIPLTTSDDMRLGIEMETNAADDLKKLRCVIWDEGTMTDQRIFQAIHRFYAMCYDHRSMKPFAGVPFVIAGDWKQTLPIVTGIRSEGVIRYTAQYFEHWGAMEILKLSKNMRTKNPEWADWLAKLGDGLLNEDQDKRRPEDQLITFPAMVNRVPTEWHVINKVYGSKDKADKKLEVFKDSAILAVTNETVKDVNEQVLQLLDEDQYIFKSVDSHFDTNNSFTALDPEVYNLRDPPGYPPYELILKIGAVVMLCKNVCVAISQTNGTRMVVNRIGAHTIELLPLNWNGVGDPEPLVIHPVEFSPFDPTSRETAFTRLQFPIRLGFAITCNKAQGQTIKRCGLILRTPCFAHGQLYVALSRVEDPANLWVYNGAKEPGKTNNVVFQKVLAGFSRDQIEELPTPQEQPANIPVPDAGGMDYDVNNDSSGEDVDDAPRQLVPAGVRVVGGAQVPARDRPAAPRTWTYPGFSARNFLKIANTGVTCFAIAAVQFVYRLWKNKLINYVGDNELIDSLMEIIRMRRRRKIITRLLEIVTASVGPDALPQDFTTEMRCSHEFLTMMISILPSSFLDDIKFFMSIVDQCNTCGRETEPRMTSQNDVEVRVKTKNLTVAEYMEIEARETVKMDCCSGSLTEFSRRRTICPMPGTRYMLVFFVIFDYNPETQEHELIERDIVFPSDHEEIFGYTWRPIFALKHEGRSDEIGHYKSFVRDERGVWICISDDQLVRENLEDCKNRLRIIVLEKNDSNPAPIETIPGLARPETGNTEEMDISEAIETPAIVSTADPEDLVLNTEFLETVEEEERQQQTVQNVEKPKTMIRSIMKKWPGWQESPYYEPTPSVITIPKPILMKPNVPPSRIGVPIKSTPVPAKPNDIIEQYFSKIRTFTAATLPPKLPRITVQKYVMPFGKIPHLFVKKGYIEQTRVHVLVNAANKGLIAGKGVDGAIRTACGPRITKDTTEIANGLPNKQLYPGQVVSTESHLLERVTGARRIYHTAGPELGSRERPTLEHEKHLLKCYFNALEKLEKDGYRSIAFPLLSIGVFHYEMHQGIAVAIQAICLYFEKYTKTRITEVHIVHPDNSVVELVKSVINGATVPLSPAEARTLRKMVEGKMGATDKLPSNGTASQPIAQAPAATSGNPVAVPKPLRMNLEQPCLQIDGFSIAGTVLEVVNMMWREEILKYKPKKTEKFIKLLQQQLSLSRGSKLGPESPLVLAVTEEKCRTAKDFFFKVLDALPEWFSIQFQIKETDTQGCQGCYKAFHIDTFPHQINLTNSKNGIFIKDLEESTRYQTPGIAMRKRCKNCNKLNDFSNIHSTAITGNTRWLAVTSGFVKELGDMETFFGRKWKIMAVIMEQPAGQQRESVVYKKQTNNTSWTIIRGKTVVRNQQLPFIKTNSLLVFKMETE